MMKRLVACMTVWVLGAGLALPHPGSTAAEPAARPEQRRFLGPDGEYLPFDTDEAVLEFLGSAEITSRERVPVGVTRPDAVILEKDGIRAKATYKDIDENYERVRMTDGTRFMNLRDYYAFERAAYELSLLLGMDNVPPTVIRRFGRRGAALQIWIENSMTELDRAEQGLRPPRAVDWIRSQQTMYLFDDLIGNVDRNAGDLVIERDSWKVWFIDHSRAFQTHSTLRNAAELSVCRRDLWEQLEALDHEAVAAQLRLYLTPAELDAMFERRDALVAHLQALIDERGEGAVLYDS